MKDIMRGAHFRAVDAAPTPHALVATLDAVAAREGVRRLKRHGRDMLAVTAGQRLPTPTPAELVRFPGMVIWWARWPWELGAMR